MLDFSFLQRFPLQLVAHDLCGSRRERFPIPGGYPTVFIAFIAFTAFTATCTSWSQDWTRMGPGAAQLGWKGMVERTWIQIRGEGGQVSSGCRRRCDQPTNQPTNRPTDRPLSCARAWARTRGHLNVKVSLTTSWPKTTCIRTLVGYPQPMSPVI